MNFQILRTREALSALSALVGLLLGMRPNVHQHLVAGVEAPILPQTVLPSTEVRTAEPNDGVLLRDVTCQIFQFEKHTVTVQRNDYD